MAIKKTYVIELQMADAQQQLTQAVAKLEQLQAELQAVGEESEAGKKLTSQLAAAAKQVQALSNEVEGLEHELATFKPGSIGALEAEVDELTLAWKRTTKGTKESQEALLALGRAKGELNTLEDAIDALRPKERAGAFADFTNGIVGGFAIASAASTQWGGLSSQSAQEVDAAMQKLMVVMSGFEAISKATNSETLANVKNMWAMGKAYLFGAESASTASKITRAALIATGIGAIVVLVGLLVANWDSFKGKFAGSEKLFTKVKEVASGVFEGLIASLKNIGGVVMKLFDGDFSGAIAKARNVGKEIAAGYAAGVQEVVDDENRELLAKQIEVQERLLKVQQAGGHDTTKLQRQILADKLAVTKQGTEEEKKAHEEAAAELAAFDAAQAKKRRDEAHATTLARLNGVAALEQAKGLESYQSQLKAKQRELADLLNAEVHNGAAIQSKRDEITTLRAQHEVANADKRRARYVQAQQDELTLLEKQGKDTLELRLSFAEQLLAYDTTVLTQHEQKQEQASEKELAQQKASQQALLLARADYEAKVREGLQANEAQRQDVLQEGRDTDAKFIGATADYLAGLAQNSAKKDFNVGTTILTKIFGVKPEDVEKTKAALNEAFSSIASSVSTTVGTLLTAGIQEADKAIQAAQDKLQELDSQLSEASSKRQADESALATATGARRTYLLGKIEAERKAEEKLAQAKAHAAQEEQQAQRTKAKLEKEQQQLSAASTAIEAVLLGIQAAQAVVKAASKGFTGWDNIALAIANTAAIVASIFTVKSAAKSFEAGTGALGSDGVLSGPRHSGGGIDIYGPDGTYYGEAEGGEAITPTDATMFNGPALGLLRTKGRGKRLTLADFAAVVEDTRQSVQLTPRPAGYFAAGTGGLGALRGGLASGYASAEGAGGLAAAQQQTNNLLGQLVGVSSTTAEAAAATARHAADTAQHTKDVRDFGPPRIVRSHAEVLEDERLLQEAKRSEGFATL